MTFGVIVLIRTYVSKSVESIVEESRLRLFPLMPLCLICVKGKTIDNGFSRGLVFMSNREMVVPCFHGYP